MIHLRNFSIRYLFYLLFFCISLFTNRSLFPQKLTAGNNFGTPNNAVLIIPKMRNLIQSEAGRLFSNAIPTLIQSSLQGSKFKWLKVTTDTALFDFDRKFELTGNLEEYGNLFRLDLQIFSTANNGENEKIVSKTYQIFTDSILVQVNRMARELASIILSSIKTPDRTFGLKVILFPFISNENDASTTGIIDYLTSSVKLNLESIPIISKVDIPGSESAGTNSGENFDILINGYIQQLTDSLILTLSVSDTKSKAEFYKVKVEVDAFELSSVSKMLVEKLKGFFPVYKEVRPKLLAFERADDFFKEGNKYLKDESDVNAKVKAEIMFNKAISLAPHNTKILVRLGDLRTKEQKYDEAVSIYKNVIAMDPLRTEAYLGLGDAYYYNYQDSLATSNYEYLTKRNEVFKKDSIVAMAYRRLGEISSTKGNYTLAIDYFDKALKFDENDLYTWYAIANAHYLYYSESSTQLEDTTDIHLAVEYFRQGRERFPQDSTFARNVAFVLNYWGKVYYNAYYNNNNSLNKDPSLLELAAIKFENAGKINNYDINLTAENLNYLAYITNLNGETEKAKSISRKAVELSPTEEWTYRLFAYLFKKDASAASDVLKSIKKALVLGENKYSYQILGEIYLTKNEFDSSYIAFSNAKRLEKEMSYQTIQGLFLSAKNNGYVEKVIPDLNDYLEQCEKKSDSTAVYIWLAEAYGEQKNFEQSLNYFRIALSLDPINKDAYDGLDSLYFKNSFEPALKLKMNILEENIDRKPEVSSILNLANSYALLKDYTKSLKLMVDAFEISKTKVDTANIKYYQAFYNFQCGIEAFNVKDSIEGKNFMDLAINQANYSLTLFPRWGAPMSILQNIYHEYIIDYNKSHFISMKLLSIDSLNNSYVANAIEDMLTSGNFEEAIAGAEKVLNKEKMGREPLQLESKLAMRFILIASKILQSKLIESFSEFGSFKRDYKNLSDIRTELGWRYIGTEKFLRAYRQIEPTHRDLLLKLIGALNSKVKKEGIIILENVENNWKSLIKIDSGIEPRL